MRVRQGGRRLFAANEALALGSGGVTAAGAATGLARSTIRRAIVELHGGSNLLGQRGRPPGGGRKRAVALRPGPLATLEAPIEDAIPRDPGTPPKTSTKPPWATPARPRTPQPPPTP